MSDREFILLVKEMRHAQAKYFDTRNSHWLETAKQLERTVDQKIKEAEDTQIKLDIG